MGLVARVSGEGLAAQIQDLRDAVGAFFARRASSPWSTLTASGSSGQGTGGYYLVTAFDESTYSRSAASG